MLAESRVCRAECASRKKFTNQGERVFVIAGQVLELPQENVSNYDGFVSGLVEYLFNEGGGKRANDVGTEGVERVMARYRAEGYEIIDTEVAAKLSGLERGRRYDFVVTAKETGSFIGIEVKTSEVGIFRLDRQQVEFDKMVLSTPGGAYVPGGGYSITGIRYEGVSLGGINARWQSFRLQQELWAVGVKPKESR